MIPSHAISCWIEGDYLYACIPPKTPGGTPAYYKFHVTEGGLSKVLKLLTTRKRPAPKHPAGATKTVLTQDERQRALALQILRDKGMLRR